MVHERRVNPIYGQSHYWRVKFVFVSSGRGTRSQNTAIYGIYELLYIAISHILGLTVQKPTYKIKVYKPLPVSGLSKLEDEGKL
jgi:hypothetical protein